MRAFFAALATLPALALATITITNPNSNVYWVQNTSKTITWTYQSGDPTPISITIINSDSTVLNGPYSVDEYVDVSTQSYTITEVTLKVGSGYSVQFVNPRNGSDIYATSGTFEVKAPGTPPASTSASGGSGGSGSGSPSSSTATSSSVNPSGTTTTSGSSGNGALPSSSNILLSVATCGVVALASLFV